MTPPLWFFFFCIFFLRKVIFYSGFILKEKTSLKKSYIPLSAPSHCPASRKLNDCLKTKEELWGGGCFWEPGFCFSASAAAPHPGTPVSWCLRGGRGAFLNSPPPRPAPGREGGRAAFLLHKVAEAPLPAALPPVPTLVPSPG